MKATTDDRNLTDFVIVVPGVPDEFSCSGRELAAVGHRCGAQMLSSHTARGIPPSSQ